jgi:hypothetical protein
MKIEIRTGIVSNDRNKVYLYFGKHDIYNNIRQYLVNFRNDGELTLFPEISKFPKSIERIKKYWWLKK